MNIDDPKLIEVTRDLALQGFAPRFGERADEFPSHPLWRRMKDLGSELWLDTGDITAIETLWTREFTALTTNNTLLNREVQKGTYDELVPAAASALRKAFPELDEAFLIREVAFVLNAYHALRLVERFDAMVSVEEHTDLAHDAAAAAAYARRYHAICPERFIVKIPLTAEGLLAARQLGRDGIPVNLTLGFSARHNVLTGVFARPAYYNVFLGRLNSVVSSNGLGDGACVGERATAASQQRIADVREPATKQIAASIRSGQQVADLAGIHVLTIPPAAAAEFLELGIDPAALERGAESDYEPTWADGVSPEAAGLDTLWHVPYGVEDAVEEVAAGADADGPALLKRLAEVGLGGALPEWSEADVARATADGKIPKLDAWTDRLATGEIGLDALMNLHGLRSFATDQKAMDDRIRGLI